jgi:general secretion pathway protein C
MVIRPHAFAFAIGCLALAHPAFASDLRLTGVLVSGPSSVAIIAGADGREKVYRLGNEILPGATLAEVSAHGIMLLRDRRREWLPLVGGSGAPVAPTPQPLQVPQKPAETNAGMAMAAEAGSKFSAGLAKPGSITPVPGGGVQLNEVTADGAYAALGLRPGDVLRSINGNPVDSGKDLNALARQLASGASGQVEVLRDGQVSVLHFGRAH